MRNIPYNVIISRCKLSKHFTSIENGRKSGNVLRMVEKAGNVLRMVEKAGNVLRMVEKAGDVLRMVEKGGNIF